MSRAAELQQRTVQTLWWAASMDRWHNQTGVAHAIHGSYTLCGARPYTTGGSYASAEATGCKECRRCRHIINKAAQAACGDQHDT